MTVKQRLQKEEILLAPGIYDAFSAMVAEQSGFEAVYLSGASIAYTTLGRSDVGLTTFTEVNEKVAQIRDRIKLPIIVDADTGFGNALNTERTRTWSSVLGSKGSVRSATASGATYQRAVASCTAERVFCGEATRRSWGFIDEQRVCALYFAGKNQQYK